MSKHIPVSIRRTAASQTGAPRPAPPLPRRRLCSEPGVRLPPPRPAVSVGPGREWAELQPCDRRVAVACGVTDAGDCGVAVGRGRHRPPRPCRGRGGGGGGAGPARRAGAVKVCAAGRAGRHKSRFVTAASALGPPGCHAWSGPGGLRGIPRPLCLAIRQRPARGAGDVARGGARAARVTAEPDTGRARRRRGRHQTRPGVG